MKGLPGDQIVNELEPCCRLLSSWTGSYSIWSPSILHFRPRNAQQSENDTTVATLLILYILYIYYGDETKTLSTLLEQIYEITFLILENEE